jgi:hypothetical protein
VSLAEYAMGGSNIDQDQGRAIWRADLAKNKEIQ